MDERRTGPDRRLDGRTTERRSRQRPPQPAPSLLKEIPWRAVAPMVFLALVSVVAWRFSQNASIDTEVLPAINYGTELETPVLSARRVPETLQQPLADSALAPEVAAILAGSGPAACLVVNEGDRNLNATNARVSLVPASNQKILTTFSALVEFGPAHTFQTRVATSAPMNSGVLNGDLFLIGGGDPFLVTDSWRSQYGEIQEGRAFTRLETLADAVAGTGVTQVNGRILADESRFDSDRYGPWAERLIISHQSGPLSALSVNEGFSAWPAVFAGTFRGRTAADDPALNAAAVFQTLLVERGIAVTGIPEVAPAPTQSQVIASITSPPLADIVTHINSYSNNYGAEVLLKNLAAADQVVGTTVVGANRVTAILERQDFDLTGVVIDDGSGLAESNRLTCGLLAAILGSPRGQSLLIDTLSIGGERGSLAELHDESLADGQVFAKTGTLNGVTALSGVVQSTREDDVELVFTYIANGESVGLNPDLKALQVPFVEALAVYPNAPLIAELEP